MPATCILSPVKCHFCGSALVRVTEAETSERLICPICWAAGDYQDVVQDSARLQRGVRIEKDIRYLVDKARFPKRDAAAASRPEPV
jgi:hypothetical protein